MDILLLPQARERNKIWYELEHQKVTATINGVTDTFDFTDMPDGVLETHDEDGNVLLETPLETIPIRRAVKENGVLYIDLLFSIDLEEDDDRLLFPEPMDLDGFNSLMEEIAQRNKTKKEEEERQRKLREREEEEARRAFEDSGLGEKTNGEIDIEGVDF